MLTHTVQPWRHGLEWLRWSLLSGLEMLVGLALPLVTFSAEIAWGQSPSNDHPAPEIRASQQDRIDHFEKFVRPILVEHCLGCHGPQKQWAGLRLDSREAILRGGESGAVAVVGNPAKSLLVAAIRRDGLAMPPDRPLSASQIREIETWVREGLAWPENESSRGAPHANEKLHWAFQPLRAVEPPATSETWAKNPIDQFIAQKLKSEKLRPSPPADRRTLIRRVYFDVLGLPPTPQEVEHFVEDDRETAYAELVNRVLESPHYAERWARHWLDLARYSDTKGYVYAREERRFVQSTAYRDWVIQAFEHDLPYDQFLLLQLAADQLSTKPSDVAAMGYLTLGRRFLGVSAEIIDDRIDVVSRGMLGLTVACARCHDHKYDPIPTADYYSLYGVFQNSAEQLVRLTVPDKQQVARNDFEKGLEEQRVKLNQQLSASRDTASDRIRQRIRDYLMAQTEISKYPVEGFDQILSASDLIPATAWRWQRYLKSRAMDDPLFGLWRQMEAIPAEDFSKQAATLLTAWQNNPPSKANPALLARFQTPPLSFRDVAARYADVFEAALRQTPGVDGPISAVDNCNSIEPADDAIQSFLFGPNSPCVLPDEQIVNLEHEFDSATVTQLWKLQGELDRWILQHSDGSEFGVAVVDRPQIQEPFVFRRGNPAQMGEQIPRRFLSAIAGPGAPHFREGSGRLELARAIVAKENPLTWRVWVNRIWQQHFGTGLVATPSDFGVRATPPSHPELLDWLALQLQLSGGSTKHIHRLILNSATYQQSSHPNPQHAFAEVKDPGNRWLWKMNTRRLGFEELRDSALSVTDELDRRRGGHSSDLFKTPHVRRTIYGVIDRQFLPSVLRNFDFANPDLHTGERSQTTVPQQALFLWNHSFLANRAQALATKAPEGDVEARLNFVFQQLWQRSPTPEERQWSRDFLKNVASEPVVQRRPESMAWSYGTAAIDPMSGQLSQWEALPHFTGSAWQGSDNWPDAKFGWAQLTATGGHPGNTLQRSVVRRWTAPTSGVVTIDSQFIHQPSVGDGVRYWIISRRSGVLKSEVVHHQERQVSLNALSVEKDDTIDFVVDIYQQLNSDQYLWSPQIKLKPTSTKNSVAFFNADHDFDGPATSRLDPWSLLIQALMASNEFTFVD